jgi:hypothetical protein
MLPPSLRLYFENPVGRVLEHPAGYAVIQYHAGPRRLSDLQAFLHHTGQLLRLRGWHKILGDQRQMEPFTEEESTWIVEYWLSPENQGRDVYAAVLLPEDVFARLSVSNLLQEAKTAALIYRVFDNEEDGVQWLLQCP